jgi:ubiquinone/menaquinone biosynthesis C-methylase UbiE
MIRFDEQYLLHLETYRQSVSELAKRERYLALLNPLPGERILDLGCGGELAGLVSPGGRVIGVDLAPAAVTLATRSSTNVQPGTLAFEQGDGHDLQFAGDSFDAAACISVLGFCRDPGRVLSELRRVLRPGGRLLLANAAQEARRYSGQNGELGRRIRGAMTNYGSDPGINQRLSHLLESSGLRTVQKETLNSLERHYKPGAAGHTLAHILRRYLIDSSAVSAGEYERWLAELAASDREGSYAYSTRTLVYLTQAQTGG